jgi:erythromycin esterase
VRAARRRDAARRLHDLHGHGHRGLGLGRAGGAQARSPRAPGQLGGTPARFLLDPSGLPGRRLERAIGVVDRPETERISHDFHVRLADQFDAVIHIDETHVLEPLERTSQWEAGELPETYPWGV